MSVAHTFLFAVGNSMTTWGNLPELPGVARDVDKIFDAIVEGGSGLGLADRSRSVKLLDKGAREVKERWDEFIEAVEIDALVVFYFAGHGALVGSHDLRLLLADSKRSLKDESTLSVLQVIRALESRRIAEWAVILDCCESSEVTRDMAVQGARTRTNRGSLIACATNSGSAWETPEHGAHFTSRLTEAIRTGSCMPPDAEFVDILHAATWAKDQLPEPRPLVDHWGSADWRVARILPAQPVTSLDTKDAETGSSAAGPAIPFLLKVKPTQTLRQHLRKAPLFLAGILATSIISFSGWALLQDTKVSWGLPVVSAGIIIPLIFAENYLSNLFWNHARAPKLFQALGALGVFILISSGLLGATAVSLRQDTVRALDELLVPFMTGSLIAIATVLLGVFFAWRASLGLAGECLTAQSPTHNITHNYIYFLLMFLFFVLPSAVYSQYAHQVFSNLATNPGLIAALGIFSIIVAVIILAAALNSYAHLRELERALRRPSSFAWISADVISVIAAALIVAILSVMTVWRPTFEASVR